MPSSRMLVASLALAIVSGAVIAGADVAAAARPRGTSSSSEVVLTAKLTSAEVVAGSSSTATGNATLTIDTVAKTLTTDLDWSGLSGPADRAHIHGGLFGEAANGDFFHEVITSEAR